ncbi:hypothetical protein HPB51_026026 [Rhipicephalus microplus]|uniref:Uncharacterized protein n=1 Tax=Rhipicephalus microplus TaxID=6941 RepID=A0A9J6EEP3_RHIMP|nr:hypothetical protein HPB51_026026 [Rhipicephalus microplus]
MLGLRTAPDSRRGEEEEAWRVRVTLYEAQRPHLVSTPESPVGPDQLPLLAHSAASMASQPDGYVRQQSGDRAGLSDTASVATPGGGSCWARVKRRVGINLVRARRTSPDPGHAHPFPRKTTREGKEERVWGDACAISRYAALWACLHPPRTTALLRREKSSSSGGPNQPHERLADVSAAPEVSK